MTAAPVLVAVTCARCGHRTEYLVDDDDLVANVAGLLLVGLPAHDCSGPDWPAL